MSNAFPSATWADAREAWQTFHPQYRQAVRQRALGNLLSQHPEAISNQYTEAIEKIASGDWEQMITTETETLRIEEELRNPNGLPTTRSSTSSAQPIVTNRLVSLEGYYVSEWRHGTLEGRTGCCFVGRWIKGAWNERVAKIEWESGHIHSGVNDIKVIFPPCGRQYGRLLLGWQDAHSVGLVELPLCGYIIIRNAVIIGSQGA